MRWILLGGLTLCGLSTLGMAPIPQTADVHFSVFLVDTELNIKPVPHHALLISKVPPSGEPTRVVTGLDGKVEAMLAPGAYRVESERATDFQGRSYRWSQSITVSAGSTSLELSVDNAVIEQSGSANARTPDLPSLFKQWQNSVVTVWGETGRGTGFLIDRRGLIVTNQHVISNFDYAAVQLDNKTKVSARILARSAEKDVAILWIAPTHVSTVEPVVLAYDENGKAPAVEGQQVFTIGSPLHQRKVMTSGIVSKIEPHVIISDVNINHGNSGGPLFTTDGRVIGITTFGDSTTEGGPGIAGIVRIDDARSLIAEAVKALSSSDRPADTLLPVEPTTAFPLDGLKATIQSQTIKAKDYTLNAGDFQLMFITPVMSYGLKYEAEHANLQQKAKRNQRPTAAPETIDPLSELRGWEEYVGEYQPVTILRAQPKLVEGFWSAVGRGMAQSRGIYAGPAQMHFKTDFFKMRVYCGANVVTPINPGKIEHRIAVSNTAVHVNDATYEGFYTFGPDAIGPQCGSVRIELFNEKEPDKVAESRTLSPELVQRIWSDFDAYRAELKGVGSQSPSDRR